MRFWASLALASATVVSCSLVLNEEAEQCSTDADCKAGGFQIPRCDVEHKVCFEGLGSAGDGGSDAPLTLKPCEKNVDCGTEGAGFVCVDAFCRAPLSPSCTEIIGDAFTLEDDVVMIGMLSHHAGSQAGTGQVLRNGVTVAHSLYASKFGGDATLPPAAVVFCQENADPIASLKHLASLGVRTVIGPQTAEAAFSARQLASELDLTLILPSATDPRLEQGDSAAAISEGHLRLVTPSLTREAVVVKEALTKIHEYRKSKDSTLPALSVAAITTPEGGSIEYQAVLQPLVQSLDISFHEYAGQSSASALAQEIVADPPTIVYAATNELTHFHSLADAILKLWPQGTPTPTFFVRDGETSLLLALTQQPQYKDTLHIAGLELARGAQAQGTYDKFTAAHQTKLSSPPALHADAAFDAFYVALYGRLGGEKLYQGQPKMAPSVSDAIQMLFAPGGNLLEVLSAEKIIPAMSVLNDLAADIHGASGDLDFDPDTRGSPTEDYQLYCFNPEGPETCRLGVQISGEDGTSTGSFNPDCNCF